MSNKISKKKKVPVGIGPSTFQVLTVCLPLFIPGVLLGICAMYAMIAGVSIPEFIAGSVFLFGFLLSLILMIWDAWKIRKRGKS